MFLLSSNIGEILLMAGAILLGPFIGLPYGAAAREANVQALNRSTVQSFFRSFIEPGTFELLNLCANKRLTPEIDEKRMLAAQRERHRLAGFRGAIRRDHDFERGPAVGSGDRRLSIFFNRGHELVDE